MQQQRESTPHMPSFPTYVGSSVYGGPHGVTGNMNETTLQTYAGPPQQQMGAMMQKGPQVNFSTPISNAPHNQLQQHFLGEGVQQKDRERRGYNTRHNTR